LNKQVLATSNLRTLLDNTTQHSLSPSAHVNFCRCVTFTEMHVRLWFLVIHLLVFLRWPGLLNFSLSLNRRTLALAWRALNDQKRVLTSVFSGAKCSDCTSVLESENYVRETHELNGDTRYSEGASPWNRGIPKGAKKVFSQLNCDLDEKRFSFLYSSRIDSRRLSSTTGSEKQMLVERTLRREKSKVDPCSLPKWNQIFMWRGSLGCFSFLEPAGTHNPEIAFK
jgi:hypothetical protein